MEVRSDDFAGLLAALGKAPPPIQPNAQYYQQFAPQPYMYPPPQTYPQYYPPPAPAVPKSNNWVIVILICAVIVFGILAWMRSTRMQEPEDRAVMRELPPPSKVTSVYEDWPAAKWPEPETVANNLLNFVKEHEKSSEPEKVDDVIDLSGVDLPLDNAAKNVGGRISADDSQTVLNYAKRREALLEEQP
jgi:hypothetical protein